jgi:hypothetical protein
VVYVIFEDPGGRPARARLVCGPYQAVRIVASDLFVLGGPATLCLASQDSSGWQICGGPHAGGPPWPLARLACAAELEAAAADRAGAPPHD